MNRQILICFLFLMIWNISLNAYGPNFKSGEIIVSLESNIRGNDVYLFLTSYSQYRLQKTEMISERSNTYLFTFNTNTISEENLLNVLLDDRYVVSAMLNYYLEREKIGILDMVEVDASEFNFQNTLNDYYFSSQWALNNTGQIIHGHIGIIGADIDALNTWNLLSTIPNINSRPIFVAARDIYLETTHDDLQENMWHPPGYIYPPLNPSSEFNSHATMTAGLISATSNNYLGISGIGGDLLDIKTIILDRRTLINGYLSEMDYFIAQRENYNNNNGGLNIVAVYHPYEGVQSIFNNPTSPAANKIKEMGDAGILFIWSSGNTNLHITVSPQLISEIPENLIVVTATTNREVRYVGPISGGGGYGKYTVNLGAPGHNIVTTGHRTLLNDYTTTWGTSFSAPYVAGVIGLMYHAASDDLIERSRTHPKEVALQFKEYLLQGVDRVPDLQETTITGGRLNAFNPVMRVMGLQHIITADSLITSNIALSKNWVIDNGAVLTISDSIVYSANHQDPLNQFFGITVRHGTLIIENTSVSAPFIRVGGPDSAIIIRNSNIKTISVGEIDIRNSAQFVIENSRLNMGNTAIKVYSPDTMLWIKDGSVVSFVSGSVEIGFEALYRIDTSSNIVMGSQSNLVLRNAGFLEIENNGRLSLLGSSILSHRGENSQISINSGGKLTLNNSYLYAVRQGQITVNNGSFELTQSLLSLDASSRLIIANGSVLEAKNDSIIRGDSEGSQVFIQNYSEAEISDSTIEKLHRFTIQNNSKGIFNNIHYRQNLRHLYVFNQSLIEMYDSKVYENNFHGIAINHSPGLNKIYFTEIYDNARFGILINGSFAEIKEGRIEENLEHGIYFHGNIKSIIGQNLMISNNRLNQIEALPSAFPIFPQSNAFRSPRIKYDDPHIPNTGYLLRANTSNSPITPRLHVIDVLISRADPSKFFPCINCFQFVPPAPDPPITPRLLYDDGIESFAEGDYEQAMEIFMGLIEDYPDDEYAILAVPLLFQANYLHEGDFEELWDFLESIEHDNLENIVLETKGMARMFNSDYFDAIYIYEDIIEQDYDIISTLLAELNQGYCYLMLQEQGSRSFPTVGKHRPNNLEEFIILQEDIFERIENLGKKEDIENMISVMDIEMGNYPNPFNPETMINFNLTVSGKVNLEIFNIRGQKIRVLIDELMPAGSHEILWNGRNEYDSEVASGVYFYRLQAGGESVTRRMVLLK